MSDVKIVVQARLNSSRFKDKILKKIQNRSIIEILLKRLSKSKYGKHIIVATTSKKNDDKLVNLLRRLNVDYFRGEEDDVLARMYKCVEKSNAKTIVRITSDCPLLDYRLLDRMIKYFHENSKLDYLTNVLELNYPDGQDIEIFKFKALKKAFTKAKALFEREHPTQYIVNDKSSIKENFNELKEDKSHIRMTVDYEEDLILIRKIINHFSPNLFFSLKDMLDFLEKNKKLLNINSNRIRNDGFKTTASQKLFEKAKKIIPNGLTALSKNPDLFLPGKWPVYFKKTKGCNIWDVDGIKYTDMSYMGMGTNILGYSNTKIDSCVKDVITKGNLSTLNATEEVLLAEKLIKMNPWASQVKFTRSGGEANAVAVRLARSVSKNKSIAVCGHHGWHDWYLASNLNKENKSVSSLSPIGVPDQLKKTIYTFDYNDFEKLKYLIEEKQIGIVKMEVSRIHKPKNNFLKKIRNITTKNNILLIFDECVSGFRETFGGLHQKYQVVPDMLILGRALGNGYAISAVIGNEKIMNRSNDTYISSIFWSERIGSVAALKTLEIMEHEKSWNIISKKGIYLKKKWKEISNKYGVPIKILGLNSTPSFLFLSNKHQKYKTYLTQYFLEKKILATNEMYMCTKHNDKNIDIYLNYFEEIIKIISDCEKGKKSIDSLIKFPLSISNFKYFK